MNEIIQGWISTGFNKMFVTSLFLAHVGVLTTHTQNVNTSHAT